MYEPEEGTELRVALQRAVADFFSIEAVVINPGQQGGARLYGRFLRDTAEAYPLALRRISPLGYTPLFREEDGRQVIVVVPGRLPTQETKIRVPAILFGLTVVSTLYVGSQMSAPDASFWARLLASLPFALSLLAILVAHETGHYLVARHFGVPATLPYFIPLPWNLLGTMGAVIQMKAPPQNRRHLLYVGIAGPLAGLVVAIPLLIIGLSLSEVGPLPTDQIYTLEGNSILYALIKVALFGKFLPECTAAGPATLLDTLKNALFGCPASLGMDVTIHPVAYAAWAGLLVTGLNLIPAGTLDGGHVMYALLGKRAQNLTWIIIVAMVLMGFLWPGWHLWAVLIFLLGRRTAVPQDDLTQLNPRQVALGILAMVLFVLTFVPIPMQILQP